MIRLYQQFRIERMDGSVDIKPLAYRHTVKSMLELMELLTKEYELYHIDFTRVYFLPEDGLNYSSSTDYVGEL